MLLGHFFQGDLHCPGWLRGRFLLHYFPDPKEELVEGCSLQAAALTQDPDYLEHLREFPSHPKFSRLFTIGLIGLAVDTSGKTLALNLESLSSQRTIAKDGVFLSGNGQLVPMIDPGGCDQDFPAMALASGLFNTLAASATFNLGHPPDYLSERRFPATHHPHRLSRFWQNQFFAALYRISDPAQPLRGGDSERNRRSWPGWKAPGLHGDPNR